MARRRWRHAAEAAGFRALCVAVRSGPRSRALAVGTRVGELAFRLGVRKRVAEANAAARLGLPPEEAGRVARESYGVMGRTFVDLLRGDRISDSEMWTLVDREGFGPVEAVAAEGKGALLVSGHFGNWELLALAIRRLGIPLAAMAGDQSNPAVDATVRSYRERAGIEPISSRSGLRDALRMLRRGGFVATLMDQDARHKGMFVDFLGVPTSTHTGVLSLARRANVPVLFGVMHDRGGSYRTAYADVWRSDPDRSEEEDLRRGALAYNRFLERQVRESPGNYFWAHRRWKTRPPGEENPG